MITFGILLAYIVNYALADAEAWRLMLGIAVVPSVLLLCGIMCMPESPRPAVCPWTSRPCERDII
nr:MFS transporter [Bacillus pumilus]